MQYYFKYPVDMINSDNFTVWDTSPNCQREDCMQLSQEQIFQNCLTMQTEWLPVSFWRWNEEFSLQSVQPISGNEIM